MGIADVELSCLGTTPPLSPRLLQLFKILIQGHTQLIPKMSIKFIIGDALKLFDIVDAVDLLQLKGASEILLYSTQFAALQFVFSNDFVLPLWLNNFRLTIRSCIISWCGFSDLFLGFFVEAAWHINIFTITDFFHESFGSVKNLLLRLIFYSSMISRGYDLEHLIRRNKTIILIVKGVSILQEIGITGIDEVALLIIQNANDSLFFRI